MEENISEEQKRPTNTHNIIYALLIVALSVSIFFNLTGSKEENIQIEEKFICEKFSDLPSSVKESYVEKSEAKQLEQQAVEKVLRSSVENELNAQESDEVLVTKEATMVEDFAKCYNMEEGGYTISKECRKNITDYVDKHSDAKYFEIIAIVDELEFKLYKSLEHNKTLYDQLGVTQKSIDNLKDYSHAGLAKHRAVEASWVIKAHTNRAAVTYTVHYELISKDGKKGVGVRAYK